MAARCRVSNVRRHFLPERLRPRVPRRRSRRRWMLPVVVAVGALFVLPMWTVRSVEIRGRDVVPGAVTTSLESLVGHLVPLLDLDWLHDVAAAWPSASDVQVHLELPGTVVVEIYPEAARGSVAVGSGWHAVAADGRLAGAVQRPSAPELVGFRRPSDRRMAFSVARRLAGASGGEVLLVEQVTPDDYRVEMRFEEPDRMSAVHVTPDGTVAERTWCDLVKSERAAVEWADLRWPHRLVLREAV